MRKIFSLLAAVLFAGSMMADPIVINASDVTTIASGATSGLDVTLQGINIVWQGAYYNSDGGDGGSASVDFRVYANKSMTLTAESNISKVEIAGYCKAGLTVTANAGTITTGASYASETTKGTLEDPLIVVENINATSVALTCTKQMRAYIIRVTLAEGGVTPPAVATPVISGEAEFTDSVIVTMTCSTQDADIYYTTDGTTDPKCDCAAAPEYKKPIVIKETTTIMAAAYTGNDWSAVATKTFTKKEPIVAISCADVYGLADNAELALNPVVVTYSNGANVWVKDETGSMLVYLPQNFNNEYVAGDTLAGIQGTKATYKGLVEVKPTPDQMSAVTATHGEAPAPEELAVVSDADVNKYILIKGVSAEGAFAEGTASNINITLGNAAYVLRNNFKNAYTFEAGKTYDVVALVSYYNALQLYFISAEEVKDTPQPAAEWTEIVFNEVVAAADLPADASFEFEGLHVAITDSENKMAIDANNAYFGTADEYTKYAFRLKTGGKSQTGTKQNFITINVPEDGLLRLAVRSGNNSDSTRTLVLAQGNDTLYNAIVKDADAIEVEVNDSTKIKVFPYVTVPVKAGNVDVAYPENGLNFYGFAFQLPVVPPTPAVNYYVAGNMNEWKANESYMLTPDNAGLYKGEFTFAANDEFKVIGFDGENTTWYPEGMGNNFKITEAGDYKITFNPAGNVEGWYEGFFNVVKKEEPVVAQYEVAEAIAAGLKENDEVLVRGIITKMEFKGKNFAKYGSVNIYVADATGAEGEFEFFNCYSLEADTFRTSTPAYDPESTTWAQFSEVVDGNGVAIHVGDTVIARGLYKLYNSTHELNTGCYLTDIKHASVAPVADTVEVSLSEGLHFVDYVAEEGWWQIMGENEKYVVSISNISTTQAEGTYTIQDLDADYTYLGVINGSDTTFVAFVSGSVTLSTNAEAGSVIVEGTLIGNDNKAYHLNLVFVAPKPENTVNLNIPEAALIDDYAAYGLYGVYGKSEDGNYLVYISVWADEAFQGEFTEADLDMNYIGSGVMDKDGIYEIYTASITVTPGNGGDYNITADLLCYNNTLYKVTMYIPAGQAIDEVDAAQKAMKMIKGGQLIIEKAGKSYNVLGTRL